MLGHHSGSETILLFGLDESLRSELANALATQRCDFHSEPFRLTSECMRIALEPDVAIVFCPADRQGYRKLIEFLKQQRPELPVVVVSRSPDTSQWLDAMEVGAADYCSAPFEPAQIRWIVETALKYRGKPH
jgi:DNA-binding NtrC family response regulator